MAEDSDIEWSERTTTLRDIVDTVSFPCVVRVCEGYESGDETSFSLGDLIKIDSCEVVKKISGRCLEWLTASGEFRGKFSKIVGEDVSIPVSYKGCVRLLTKYGVLRSNKEYTLQEVIQRFSLPQIVQFTDQISKEQISPDIKEAIDNLDNFEGKIILHRVYSEQILFGHYKSIHSDPAENKFLKRTAIMIPLNNPELEEVTVQYPLYMDSQDYEVFVIKNFSDTKAGRQVMDRDLYMEYTKKSRFAEVDDSALSEKPDEPPPRPCRGASSKVAPVRHFVSTRNKRPDNRKLKKANQEKKAPKLKAQDGHSLPTIPEQESNSVYEISDDVGGDESEYVYPDLASSENPDEPPPPPPPRAPPRAPPRPPRRTSSNFAPVRPFSTTNKRPDDMKFKKANQEMKANTRGTSKKTEPLDRYFLPYPLPDDYEYPDVTKMKTFQSPKATGKKCKKLSVEEPDSNTEHENYDYPDITKMKISKSSKATRKKFKKLTVEELEERLHMCSMDDLARICRKESYDGKMFSKLPDTVLQGKPFNLDTKDFIKLNDVKKGWTPKFSKDC